MLIKLTEEGLPAGQPPITDQNFRSLFPEKIFLSPLSPQEVESVGWGLYDYAPKPTMDRYEKAVEVTPVKDDLGIWRQTWAVEPMDDKQKAALDRHQSKTMRDRRMIYLYECDWTQLPDNQIPEEKRAAWRAYRQELRDVPEQEGFPWIFAWPTKPE